MLYYKKTISSHSKNPCLGQTGKGFKPLFEKTNRLYRKLLSLAE